MVALCLPAPFLGLCKTELSKKLTILKSHAATSRRPPKDDHFLRSLSHYDGSFSASCTACKPSKFDHGREGKWEEAEDSGSCFCCMRCFCWQDCCSTVQALPNMCGPSRVQESAACLPESATWQHVRQERKRLSEAGVRRAVFHRVVLCRSMKKAVIRTAQSTSGPVSDGSDRQPLPSFNRARRRESGQDPAGTCISGRTLEMHETGCPQASSESELPTIVSAPATEKERLPQNLRAELVKLLAACVKLEEPLPRKLANLERGGARKS